MWIQNENKNSFCDESVAQMVFFAKPFETKKSQASLVLTKGVLVHLTEK